MLKLLTFILVWFIVGVLHFTAGNYIEELCESDSNCTAVNSHCSLDFQICTCPKDFPVRVNSSLCDKVTKLLEKCIDDSTCQYFDPYAICHQVRMQCTCKQNYKMMLSPTSDELSCVYMESEESDEDGKDSNDDDDDDDDEDDDHMLRNINRKAEPAPIIAGAVLVGIVVLSCVLGCYKHIAKSMERRRRMKRYIDDQLKAMQNQAATPSDSRWIEMMPLSDGDRLRPEIGVRSSNYPHEDPHHTRHLLPNVPEEPEFPPSYEEATTYIKRI